MNDAVIVKQFHLWGRRNQIQTSTVHDAFFTNAADMLEGRDALRVIYANALDKNSVKATLDEMHARGLPDELYDAYLEEAIAKGLIPVVGKSKVGDRYMKDSDILKREDVLVPITHNFSSNRYWYGVG